MGWWVGVDLEELGEGSGEEGGEEGDDVLGYEYDAGND